MENLLSMIENRIASLQPLLNAPDQRDRHADCQNHENVTHVVGPKVYIGNRTSTFLTELAKAGFYYSQDNGIRCFWCHFGYNCWQNESPVAVHKILNPDCKYLNLSESSYSSLNNDTCFTRSLENCRRNLFTSDVTNASCHSCVTSQQPEDEEENNQLSSFNETPSRTDNSVFKRLVATLIYILFSAISLILHPVFVVIKLKTFTTAFFSALKVTYNNQLQNTRRNLFSDETNEINGSERSLQNSNDVMTDVVNETNPIEHGDEYSGKIVHPKLGDKKLMAVETFRLLTFPNPTDKKAKEWAKNGFIYCEDNRVQCVYCEGCASFDEVSVKNIHQRISPKGRYCCPLVSGIDVGDVSRKLEILVRQKLLQRDEVQDNLSVSNSYLVLHPQFKTTDQRQTSFKFWPKQYKPTSTELAQTGFFHTGVGTKVVCFCCGVSIIDWEPTAEPWQQHALISPQCTFIKHEKGEEFITQMANIEKLVDEDPSVTEPVTRIGDLMIPDPYPPTLDTTLLAAFSSCGYTRQQLFHLVQQIFKLTRGRYPNIAMLKAAVLADGELKKKDDLNNLQGVFLKKKDEQLDNLDHVMSGKDRHYRTSVATINQEHCQQLDNKDLELHQINQQHRQQLQHNDQQHRQQLQGQNQQLQQYQQQLCQKDQQNHQLQLSKQQLRQQLNDKDNQIEQQSNQLEAKDNQLQEQSNQLQTAVSRHEERERSLVQERNSLVHERDSLVWQRLNKEREIKNFQEELSTLAKQYTKLKRAGIPIDPEEPNNNKICLFCLTEERIVMFAPCRHVCSCLNCAPNFRNKPCPLCRVPIEDWQIVFLS